MKKAVLIMLMLMIAFCIPAQAKTVAKETYHGYTLKVTQKKGKTRVFWNGKLISAYKFSGKVKIIPERKLTYKKLVNRKNKILYIERVKGKVTSKNLDGKSAKGYICYNCLRGKVTKGNKVITWFVYSPFTNSIDDITDRFDVPVKYYR